LTRWVIRIRTFPGQKMKAVASNATVVVLKGGGHWVMEEKQKEMIDAIMKFL